MSTAQEFESMKQAMRRQQLRASQTHQVRMVNTIKWKQLMVQALQDLAKSARHDARLLEGLKGVVLRVPDDKFIEAIMNLQPYKPHADLPFSQPLGQGRSGTKMPKFELSPRKEGLDEVTTSCGSVLKRSELEQLSAAKKLKSRQRLMAAFIQEEVLAKEISSPHHPFARIIEGYSSLLENKYKIIIEKQLAEQKLMPLDHFTEMLAQDFELAVQFMRRVSEPIIDIFDLKEEQREAFAEEVHSFMVGRLRNSEKLCGSMRKIIRYYVKHSKELREYEENCPGQAEIEKYDIPAKFQIEGCFVYTTAEIIAFAEHLKGRDGLGALTAVRKAIYRDIDEYYAADGQGAPMEVSSAVQLEILKFCMVKVKIFAGDVLSGLMLLSTVYGEEMGFHFDEASYIHSQLSIAFDALQLNL